MSPMNRDPRLTSSGFREATRRSPRRTNFDGVQSLSFRMGMCSRKFLHRLLCGTWASRQGATMGRARAEPVARLGLALLRVPVALEVGDQGRAEVAIGLLPGIDRHVAAEEIEGLLRHAERPAVAGGTHDAGA